MYRYIVLLNTTYTDGLYFFVKNCALLYNLTLPTQTSGAHTVLVLVVLLYIYTLVHSLYTLGLYYCVHNCTVQLYAPW